MSYYKNSTQTPNILFTNLLKTLSESELKVLLTIIHRTIGQVDTSQSSKRKRRAWISQKLFCMCTGNSNKSVSQAIDGLVCSKLIRVTDEQGRELYTKTLRRGAHRLYYESCLQLSSLSQNSCEQSSHNAVNNVHTIKLNSIKEYCEKPTQGFTRLTDRERLEELKDAHKP